MGRPSKSLGLATARPVGEPLELEHVRHQLYSRDNSNRLRLQHLSARLHAPRILGIDIGAAGGLALITPGGDIIEVADMPILHDGPTNRATFNCPLLAEIVYRCHATEAFVEHVSARPREGAVGAFAFGRSRGVIEGVSAVCSVPVTFITPASWKRAVGLTLASMDASRSAAVRRWPSRAALFARVKDDGRAEAALIAAAGLACRARGGEP